MGIHGVPTQHLPNTGFWRTMKCHRYVDVLIVRRTFVFYLNKQVSGFWISCWGGGRDFESHINSHSDCWDNSGANGCDDDWLNML